MRKKAFAIIFMTVCLTASLLSGCKKKYQEVDLSSHTTEAPQPETTVPPTAAPTTAAPQPTTAAAPAYVQASIETYTDGDIKIAYPVVTGLSDATKQNNLNAQLKENALSIIDAYGLKEKEGSADISCKVITINRGAVCVTYDGLVNVKGAAYPSNVFYANTVNIETLKNMGFSDYADPFTQAGYVLSSDVKLRSGDQELRNAFLQYRDQSFTAEQLTDMFKNADFPVNGEFPESFSYSKDGDLFYSVPVPHALGDYVIIAFSLEGK